MQHLQSSGASLAERLCRPQRLGIFGHRGVGKTTLLTMLYREGVGGRLPELRLAAADARTAEYLSDKILQLEAGQTLPATLAETELRFHLYHHATQIDLLVKDYQGEHIELNREEPIREFLRDCDAVWLCLDAGQTPDPAPRLRRQQEIEHLLEDYLTMEPQAAMQRPVALVLTKVDLLGPEPERVSPDQWAAELGMTRHALQTHYPNRGLFAVSSLGRPPIPSSAGAWPLAPFHLTEPLVWLVGALQVQDEARLEQLFSRTGQPFTRLQRCVQCFARRYPDAPAAAGFQQQLKQRRRRQGRRRWLLGTAAAACLTGGLWSYDALGARDAALFEADHTGDPGTILEHWQHYQQWHPTRNLLQPVRARTEEEHLRELGQEARQQEYDRRLADLKQRAADPEAEPEVVWEQFHAFHAAFPEAGSAEFDTLRTTLKTRLEQQVSRRAHLAHEELVRAEQSGTELTALAAQADHFLRDFPDSAETADVKVRREAYLLHLDQRDLDVARDFSARQPLNFPERGAQYQRYLDRHPGGGLFTTEAEAAVRSITDEWDRHDFREVRDLFQANPGDLAVLVPRCRTYLAVHPEGRFVGAARDVLRWSEQITEVREYRVEIRTGQFDKSIGHYFSRGPKLSVELEVNG
ncbi:MAG: GTPase domain-containing protein, partial [Planctomycetes bacterium]|nr:GTPase domain-containing protein [Planctomycetota bacterium]